MGDPSRWRSIKVGLIPALVAIGAAAAAQTAFLPWLPSLVDAGLVGQRSGNHDIHVAVLSAIFPLGGMLTAPLWGWLSDRYNFRTLLVLAVATLALTTALTGATSLPNLYLLRLLAGVSFGAVVPLCLLAGNQAAAGDNDKARLFTMLTASLFLGDFAGPLLAEASARFSPQMPLLYLGSGIGTVALALAFARSPRYYWHVVHLSGNYPQDSKLLVLALLGLTFVGTGGLAAVHLSMVLHRPEALLGREQIAWMLSLCGLAMLAAQAFHAKLGWLVTKPAPLAAGMLILLGVALWLFSLAQSGPAIAAAVFAAGWSAATLRLIASFWISAPRNHAGLRLGFQHGVASVGQVAIPLATALSRAEWHRTVLWGTIFACIVLLLAVPLVWPRKGRRA
jgi:MFS family permease